MVALRQISIAKRYKTQAGRNTRCTWNKEISARMITKSMALAPSRGQKVTDGVVRATAKGAAIRAGGAVGLGDSTPGGVPDGSCATGTRFLLRSIKYKLNDPRPARSTMLPARNPITGIQ